MPHHKDKSSQKKTCCHSKPKPNLDDSENHKDSIYLCPMHPEVRQSNPGNCPICGMALEAERLTLEDVENHEYRDMNHRFWVALFLTLPLVILDMSGHSYQGIISAHMMNWVSLFLASPVVLWGGWPFFQRGLASLKSHQLNMFTLILHVTKKRGRGNSLLFIGFILNKTNK